jgi:16S rRNA (cytidine1402-2'-O)-methyltransferase
MKEQTMTGTLFICGTPIGNLEDVTIRLLKVLRGVELIACEDTRHTLRLLNRYRIKKPLLSYHEFSKPAREEEILRYLADGKDVAYVSDAGMPLISDPGQRLVQKALSQAYPVEVIPGPSAGVTALVVSGLDTETFVFLGFPPEKDGRRKEFFRELAEERRTLILYEAPHRIQKTLRDVKDIMGAERRIAVARELTKRYQEISRGTAAELCAYYAERTPKGEFCLIIAGQEPSVPDKSLEEITTEVVQLIAAGWEKKAALKHKAAEYQVPKSVLYKLLFN